MFDNSDTISDSRSASVSGADEHTVSHHDADAAFLVVADAQLLFTADFKRAGPDLTLTGADGRSFRVIDYFRHEKLPNLASPDGALLSADMVEKLAGSLAPNQYAQATAPAPSGGQGIGRVDKLTGSVTVVRNGASVILNIGDAINKGDVVQTGSNSTVNIAFVDGTVLTLTANTRMGMNDFVYDANSTSNSGLLSLVQGSFVFVAGQVAKTGGLDIQTPVATMGIRGTAGGGSCADAGSCNFFAVPDPNGHDSVYTLYDHPGGTVLGTVTVNSAANVTATGTNQLATFTPVQGVTNLTAEQQALVNAAQHLVQTYPQIFVPQPQQQQQQQQNQQHDNQNQGPSPQSSPNGGSSSPPPPPTNDESTNPPPLATTLPPPTTQTVILPTTGSTTDLTTSPTSGSNGSPDNIVATVTITPPPTATLTVTSISSDNGISASDFVTNTTTLMVSGTNGPLAAGEKVQISSNGGATWSDVAQNTTTSWSYDDTATPHTASFTYQVQVINAANVVGTTAQQAVTIDTTPPATPVISQVSDDVAPATGPIADSGTTNDPTPTFSGTAEAGSFITIYDGATSVGTGQADGSGNFAIATSVLTQGFHTLTVTAKDLAGNESTAATFHVTVTTSAPTAAVAITAITDDTGTSGADFVTNDTSLAVSGTNGALGSGEKVQISSDGGTTWFDVTQGTTTSWSYDDTANPHSASFTYQARVINAASVVGNTASQLVTVDTAAPGAPVIASATDNVAPVTGAIADHGYSNDTTLTVNGTAEAGSAVTIYDNGSPVGIGQANASGQFAITTSVLSEGAHTLTARTVDVAGNVSGVSSDFHITVDTLPPAIAITTIEGGDATINAAEAAGGIVIAGTTEAGASVDVNGVAAAVDGSGNWTVTLAAPGADGPLPVTATATDAAGNTASASTTLTVDATAPAIAITTIEGGDATINAAEAAGGIVIAGTTEAGASVDVNGVAAAVDGSGNWTVTLAAPGADGPLPVTATATDAAGNTASASTTLTVDATAPAIAITTIEGGDATINAAEAAGGIVIAGTTEAGASVDVNGVAAAVDGSGNWTVTLAAPGADGPLPVTATATDAAGNTASASTTLTVDATAPAIAITTIEGGDATINAAEAAGGIVIAGTTEAGASVDVNGVAAAVDGSGNWTVTLAAPGADGPLPVTATATDAAGNTASASTTLTVDATAPAVSINAIAGDDVLNAQEAQSDLSISGITTGVEDGQHVTVGFNGQSYDALVTAGTWTATVPNADLLHAVLADGDYTVTADVSDLAGNPAPQASHTLTVNEIPLVTLTIVTDNGYDLHGINGELGHADGHAIGATHDATYYDMINTGSGHTIHLVGSGFTYDGSGNLTGGTISEIDIFNTATSDTLVTMTGFAIDAVAYIAAAAAVQVGDFSQLNAIFNQYAFSETGGAGNDVLPAYANADTFDGGSGLNTVDYLHYQSGITVNLADPSQNTGNAAGDTYTNINSVIGTNSDDILYGDANINALEGGAGADELHGNGGALDFASYIHAATGVIANLADPGQNTGDAAGDSYFGINGLIGSNSDDVLVADDSGVYLRGRGGADTLIGGTGIDTADYNNRPWVRVDLTAPGSNRGDAYGDSYVSIENIRGSHFGDVLKGDAGANVITGQEGADIFIYSGGADTFDFSQTDGDRIDLAGTGITNWAQLQPLISQNGGDTLIDFGSGNTMTLTGVTANALTDADFIYGAVALTIVTDNGIDLHGLYGDISYAVVNTGTATTTQFNAINSGSGHTLHVVGTGLTYDSGHLSGGLISRDRHPRHGDRRHAGHHDRLCHRRGRISRCRQYFQKWRSVRFDQGRPAQLHLQPVCLYGRRRRRQRRHPGLCQCRCVDGGGGFDAVDYVHYGAGITVNLADPSQNTGNAAGDSLTNITNVIGTNYDDTLIGDGNVNRWKAVPAPMRSTAAVRLSGGGPRDYASYIHAPEIVSGSGIGVVADLADPTLNTGDAAGDTYSNIYQPDRLELR